MNKKHTISAKRIEEIFRDSLFRDGEDTKDHVIAEGVTCKVGFHPGRLEVHRGEVQGFLNALPPLFTDGWSFLNACVTRDGDQWGEHRNVEQLLQLGIALKLASWCAPREMWRILPGGMPYVQVTQTTHHEN